MKWLGDMTVVLSLLMLVFVFLVDPTHYFLSNLVVSIGNILTQTVHHSFELYLFHNRDWSNGLLGMVDYLGTICGRVLSENFQRPYFARIRAGIHYGTGQLPRDLVLRILRLQPA